MSLILACSQGATLVLPSKGTVHIDRLDGGHLVVNPSRSVWERSELSPKELFAWQCLTAAAGQAMLQCLPQLDGGCINYWEAGNWALNNAAPPEGTKRAPEHRIVHLHLLGRSPASKSKSWVWGEAPRFPLFKDRMEWTENNQRLTQDETAKIVLMLSQILQSKFGISDSVVQTGAACPNCGYTSISEHTHETPMCGECRK